MTPDQRALYAAVMARHARPRSDGVVMLCRPSNGELAGTDPRKEDAGTDNRPIFDTADTAEAAAAELHAAGAQRQEVYVCARSRTGHLHLRTAAPVTIRTRQDGGPQ